MGSNANTQGAPPPQGGFVRTDIPTTPEGMKKKILNLGTIITMVAGILVLVGAFMAWVTISVDIFGVSMSESAKIGDMAEEYPEVWIVPIMGILILIMPFIKFPIGSSIMGIIAMLIPIETYIRLTGDAGALSDYYSLGIGSIIIIIGGIIAIIGGPLAHKMSKVIPLPPQ